MIRRITFRADPDHIDAARERARANNTTVNAQFRLWLQEYVDRCKAAAKQAQRDPSPKPSMPAQE
jgi:hypothetical protein